MPQEIHLAVTPETVPLQHAVLCVDCELVTASHTDHCPVCGGHSLLSLAGIVGGSLVDYKDHDFHQRHPFLFDLNITIDMPQMEAAELSATIEGISHLLAPHLGHRRGSLHINVEPINNRVPTKLKAA
jgi:hypothetical protein